MSGPAGVERDLEALAERVRAGTVAVRVGRAGAGSGVVWASDGLIVTNAHVASRSRADVVLADDQLQFARCAAAEDRDPHGLPYGVTAELPMNVGRVLVYQVAWRPSHSVWASC